MNHSQQYTQNVHTVTHRIVSDSRTGECKVCHNIMDLVNEVVKKSKDVIECEKLGLKGAVHKNDKGQWEEWKDPYQINEVMR